MLYRLIMQAAVNPVEKLGVEFTLHDFFNDVLDGNALQTKGLHFFRQIAEFIQILLRRLCPDIAGHKDHAVAKIDSFGARCQCQPASIQHVHQAANHLVTGFFQFIKQHDAGPGMTAGNRSFIKQAVTFLGADITRRCTGQSRCIMFLRQSIHINPAKGIRAAIDRFGNQTHGFCFTDASRAQHQGNRQRAIRTGKICLDHMQHFFNFIQGCILPNNPFT